MIDELVYGLGLNPEVFLPVLKGQFVEPYNLLAGLFVMHLPRLLGTSSFWLYVCLPLLLGVLFMILTIKLQLGLFPDVSIIEMFKVIGPVGFIYWLIGVLISFVVPKRAYNNAFKHYLFWCVLTAVAFGAVSIGYYNFPPEEMINFSKHIILASPHAKGLLITPLVLAILVFTNQVTRRR